MVIRAPIVIIVIIAAVAVVVIDTAILTTTDEVAVNLEADLAKENDPTQVNVVYDNKHHQTAALFVNSLD